MRACRRLCLADLLATPEALLAAALELSEDRDSGCEGRSTCHCLAVVLDICAKEVWSAVQVRRCACYAHVRTVQFACHQGTCIQSTASLLTRLPALGFRHIAYRLQECWQKSRRMKVLSALLSAIFQGELFSRDWEEGCAADARCRHRGSDACAHACPTSI